MFTYRVTQALERHPGFTQHCVTQYRPASPKNISSQSQLTYKYQISSEQKKHTNRNNHKLANLFLDSIDLHFCLLVTKFYFHLTLGKLSGHNRTNSNTLILKCAYCFDDMYPCTLPTATLSAMEAVN